MEYYLAIKKQENLATTWTELENIMLSELHQTKKDILYKVTYIQMIKNKNKEKNECVDTENRLVVSKGKGWGDE